MSVDWTGYAPFDPGIAAPVRTLPRPVAQAAYDRLMAAKGERTVELTRLLANNGVNIDRSDAGIQRLQDWFTANVEGSVERGRLGTWWYAAVNDIGLWLGDALIERAPSLHWQFWTRNKADITYQAHVVAGFKGVPSPHYHFDPDGFVATIGHRAAVGLPINPEAFVNAVRSAAEKA